MAILFLLCLGGLGGVSVDAWGVYNIEHYGAISGCKDCTASIHATLAAARSENPNGAEVLIPKHGVYISSPINITSNIILRVNGNLTAIRDESKFPNVELLPSSWEDLDITVVEIMERNFVNTRSFGVSMQLMLQSVVAGQLMGLDIIGYRNIIIRVLPCTVDGLEGHI